MHNDIVIIDTFLSTVDSSQAILLEVCFLLSLRVESRLYFILTTLVVVVLNGYAIGSILYPIGSIIICISYS